MTDVVVTASGISKKFARNLKRSLAYGVADICRELLGRSRNSTLRPGEFWALRDVTLELRRGLGLGLIGPNGSGKTTLLKILSGLVKPDAGEAQVLGRVAPLFALGAAFNPVLSGKENVHLNMAMLGLDHRETLERYEEVVRFADIGDAIDAPLQTYSSGMTARLGFACAISTSPDVVFVDEVLAVGDMAFRAKSYRKLAELRRKGVAVVVVSHSMNAILSMADEVIYLRRGEVVARGEPEKVVTQYENDMASVTSAPTVATGSEAGSPVQKTALSILAVRFVGESGTPLQNVIAGRPATLAVRYRAERPVAGLHYSILVRALSHGGELVLNLSSGRDKAALSVPLGEGVLKLNFVPVVLAPGLYVAKVVLADEDFYIFDAVEEHRFVVQASGGMNECRLYQPRTWSVEPQRKPDMTSRAGEGA